MVALLVAVGWFVLGLGVVGVIWIAVIAFQNEEPIWGVAALLCFPAAIIYGVMRFDEAKIPLIFVLVAGAFRVGVRLLLAAQ